MALAGLNLVIISLFAVLLFFLCNNFILEPLKRKYQLREKKNTGIFNLQLYYCYLLLWEYNFVWSFLLYSTFIG